MRAKSMVSTRSISRTLKSKRLILGRRKSLSLLLRAIGGGLLGKAHGQLAARVAGDRIELVAGGGEQDFLVGSRAEDILEDGERQVVTLDLVHGRPITVVEAVQHFKDIEIDGELGLEADRK